MKFLLTLVLGLSPVTLGACRSSAHGADVAVATVRLHIVGMTCAVNCPPRVEAALESVSGVQSAVVDYDARTATVRCVGPCDSAALVAALQKQGFDGALD